MPRCCSSTPDDFKPCYASVLVSGGGGDALKKAVLAMEGEEKICPCVTAWCGSCKRLATVTASRGLYATPSAHLAHMLTLRGMVEGSLRF